MVLGDEVSYDRSNRFIISLHLFLTQNFLRRGRHALYFEKSEKRGEDTTQTRRAAVLHEKVGLSV